MVRVVGVSFKRSGRVYWFDPGEYEIHTGDGVIVETVRGTEYGEAVSGISEVAEEQVVQPLKPIIRVATAEDRALKDSYIAKEADALVKCQELVSKHKLEMKLVDAEYTFNSGKLIFYFTADERVDFRELVKDLAAHFKTRIDLRQIGVRDEAKMLGGLGPCGRPVCCKEFLDDFRPVSIKMAKEQNLSLSPTKISGLCGRLMCCLQYEQNVYDEMKKLMPRVGREISTPEGVGTVTENNAITEKTRVRLTLPDGTFDLKWFHYTEVAPVGETARRREQDEPAEENAGSPAEATAAVPAAEKQPPRAQRSRPNREKKSGEGRDHRNRKQKGTTAEQQEAGESAAATEEKKDQPRRRHHDRRKPQEKPAASAEGAAAAQPAGNGADKPKPHRRHRSRKPGPKPEAGAPGKEE